MLHGSRHARGIANLSKVAMASFQTSLQAAGDVAVLRRCWCSSSCSEQSRQGMNIDVPPWVSHGEQSIFSIDVDSVGKKVATAGSDAKVKVWSLRPLLSAAAEEDENRHPQLLATLTEHCAPVNTVRFSSDGRRLATCSDDRLAFVFELHPGPGKTVFGSSDKPSLENWKLLFPLRGHSNNVIDVAWSPDDSLLATCSLDNTTIIWNSHGKQVAVLEGHSSYVKGIAWDPIGTYLATQSDDKSIIIWRVSDWRLVKQIKAPFHKGFISQTFSLRLSWTPDGQHIVGVNSFVSPSHCACVLTRGEWDAALSVVGHNAAVTVVAFSPLLFKDPDGAAEPTTCFALGSQDQRVTVWLSSGERPTLILNKVFAQSVADLAWTQDGHTLLACSTDGRVAVARFEPGSLGEPLDKTARESYMQSIYGERPASRMLLPESALLLDHGEPANGNAAAAQTAAAGPAVPHPPVPDSQWRGPQPTAGTVPGRLPPAAPPASVARLHAPPHSNGDGPSAKRPAEQPAGQQRSLKMARRLAPEATQPSPLGRAPLAGTGTAAASPYPPGAPGLGVAQSLQPPRVLSVRLGEEELPVRATLTLEVANVAGAAQVVCKRGASASWRDQLRGSAMTAAGNTHFSAVALHNGSLQVYSAAGRQVLPSIALGSVPRHLAAGAAWQLMAVCADASVRLWDLQAERLLVRASLSALRGAEVVGARLTEGGSPLVMLADGSAYMLHLGLQEWLCIVDPAFAASSYASMFSAGSAAPAGELGRIEAEAAAARAGPSGAAASALAAPASDGRHQVEVQVGASLALGSGKEYRRWLLTYVRHLAGTGNDGILREVCRGLLGPVRRAEVGGAPGAWDPVLLGMDKRTLLREVLKEVSRHRTHQRLLAEFTDLLKAAENPE